MRVKCKDLPAINYFCSCFFIVSFLVCPVNIAFLLYVQRKKQKCLEDIVKTFTFATWKVKPSRATMCGTVASE